MQHFKSVGAMSQLSDNHPSKPLVQEYLSHYLNPDYQWRNDGWVMLVEHKDSYEPVFNGQTLIDINWEAVTLQQGHYVCAYVPNDQFCLLVIMQCDDWMDFELKEYLDEHLDSQYQK